MPKTCRQIFSSPQMQSISGGRIDKKKWAILLQKLYIETVDSEKIKKMTSKYFYLMK